MGAAGWQGLQRLDDHLLDSVVVELSWGARSGLVREAFDSPFDETRAPDPDRLIRRAKLPRDFDIGSAFGTGQHDLRSEREVRIDPTTARKTLQLFPLFGYEYERSLWPSTFFHSQGRSHPELFCEPILFQGTRVRPHIGKFDPVRVPVPVPVHDRVCVTASTKTWTDDASMICSYRHGTGSAVGYAVVEDRSVFAVGTRSGQAGT